MNFCERLDFNYRMERASSLLIDHANSGKIVLSDKAIEHARQNHAAWKNKMHAAELDFKKHFNIKT